MGVYPIMQSSRMISLFAEPPSSSRGPSAFLLSTLLHGLVFGLLIFGLNHTPRIDEKSLEPRDTVRLLNLHDIEPKIRWSGGGSSGGGSNGSRPEHAIVRAPAAPPAASSGGQSSGPAVPAQLEQRVSAPQTLVQPDLPPNLVLAQRTPVPFVMMWSPENIPVKKIVPPVPQPITAADVRPSLLRPNRELNLADLKISATAFATRTPSLPPSTTAPLTVRGPELIRKVPETASKPLARPTPATIMSLSDLHLEQGTIAIPMVNETAPTPFSGPLAPVRPKTVSETGGSGTATNSNGRGTGANSVSTDSGSANSASATSGSATSGSSNRGSGNTGSANAGGANAGSNNLDAANSSGSGTHPGMGDAGGGGGNAGAGNSIGQGNQDSAASGTAGGKGTQSGSNGGSDAGYGLGSESATDRIVLPKDGKYGVIVVGSSLEEEYPETRGIWTDRLAYTVYLHVGAAKSWILQYSLPRSAEASVAGNITRPEAPWPYVIMRPHLSLGDSNADAVMVHGFVNEAGRFEKLAIVFPPEFPQTKLLLGALEKWQFRAAMQNHKMVAVEVLLVIPEEPE
jgi:hypothetical protein